MTDHDTPSEALPVRHPAEVQVIDATFFREWRRALDAKIDDTRQEQREDMREVRQRLAGIDGHLAENRSTQAKHSDQIAELIDQVFEQEQRLRSTENILSAGIVARLGVLEAAETKRSEQERIADALAQAADRSPLRQAVRDGAFDALKWLVRALVILAVIGLGWALLAWATHGAPGARMAVSG